MRKSIIYLFIFCLLIGCDQKEIGPEFFEQEIRSDQMLRDVAFKSYHAQSGVRLATISQLIGHVVIEAVSQPTPIIWNFWPYYLSDNGSLQGSNLLCGEYPNSRECAIASILQAQGWIDLCLSYGDIPYSQALKGGKFSSPVYDPQEVVIKDNLQKLEELAEGFEAQAYDQYGGGDNLFLGNQQDWAATAYALLARYYLILSKKESDALSKAQLYLEKSLTLFQNESVMDHLVPPLQAFENDRATLLPINFFLFNLVSNRNDPRVDVIAYYSSYDNTFWFQDDAPFSLVSLEEMYFMSAEIALRNGQIANAQQDLSRAVTLSFEKMEITDYDDYFLSHAQINTSDPLSAQLDSVFTEKLYALFHSAPDILWNDFRRTGFPSVLENLSPLVTPSNPDYLYPQRTPYPQSEFTNNQENVESAISRQGNGTGDLRDVLWVFE